MALEALFLPDRLWVHFTSSQSASSAPIAALARELFFPHSCPDVNLLFLGAKHDQRSDPTQKLIGN